MFSYAITRQPGEDFAQGITTSAGLGPPVYTKMLQQHAAYEQTLQSLGLRILHLDALPGFPDAHFIEDTAIITPELAVLTNPGALSRQGEVHSVRQALAPYRPIAQILPPGTVEGGDVFWVDKRFFIGISERTNLEGANQLARLVLEFGYSVNLIPVGSGLHLKSSVNPIAGELLLVTQDFASRGEFAEYKQIRVPPGEEYAANTLWVNHSLIMPAGFPKTRCALNELGIPVIELDMSEAQKMDGGLTCLSLRF